MAPVAAETPPPTPASAPVPPAMDIPDWLPGLDKSCNLPHRLDLRKLLNQLRHRMIFLVGCRILIRVSLPRRLPLHKLLNQLDRRMIFLIGCRKS